MVLETNLKLCVTEPVFFGKVFSFPKIGKMDPKWAKRDEMRHETRYETKCSQPIKLQDFLINHISSTNNESLIVLHYGTNLHKLKVDQKMFGWMWPKLVWPAWSQGSKTDCISRMHR